MERATSQSCEISVVDLSASSRCFHNEEESDLDVDDHGSMSARRGPRGTFNR